MQVDFYQLGRDPLATVLASIAGRVLAGGGRLLVVAGEEAQAAAIDEGLWAISPDSFIPHGRVVAGDAGEDQPVLIAPDCVPANGARHVALADGRWRDAALEFERAFHFFDEGTIAEARLAWKALAGKEGVTRNYWAQDEGGRWSKVA
ncbi:MAG TPA: DNA polymerase III subunit chi [Sphingomonas sp.]